MVITPNELFDCYIPIGTIIIYPGEIYDKSGELREYLRLGGWIEAKGQELDREQYKYLFEVIGNKYSFNVTCQNQFKVPDLRGLFVRGVQNEAREVRKELDDPGAINKKRLEYTNLYYPSNQEEYNQVGTIELQSIKKHSHKINPVEGFVPEKGVTCKTFINEQAPMTIDTSEIGGEETRPTNIGMYYLIKASHSVLKRN